MSRVVRFVRSSSITQGRGLDWQQQPCMARGRQDSTKQYNLPPAVQLQEVVRALWLPVAWLDLRGEGEATQGMCGPQNSSLSFFMYGACPQQQWSGTQAGLSGKCRRPEPGMPVKPGMATGLKHKLT